MSQNAPVTYIQPHHLGWGVGAALPIGCPEEPQLQWEGRTRGLEVGIA